MLHALRRWLSPTQQLRDEVRELHKRLVALEAAELERETVVADQLDKLAKLVKRVRMRADRAARADSEQLDIDPISAQIIARRRALYPHGNGE